MERIVMIRGQRYSVEVGSDQVTIVRQPPPYDPGDSSTWYRTGQEIARISTEAVDVLRAMERPRIAASDPPRELY